MDISRSKALQDLSVLVAEVESGGLVHFHNPNYPSFAGAIGTIKSILDRLMSGKVGGDTRIQAKSGGDSQPPPMQTDEPWVPWSNNDFWDSDMDFWLNLADHPALI